ncbi:MAG: TerC family protein [Porphyromonadaceae bacterium]|nr:MAG: TerC family protein [Porphyromonadaceae bacterium]
MESIPENALMWAGFVVFIILMLLVDLVVFNRKTHEIKMKEALLLSLFWISLAIVFNLGVWRYLGQQKALEFLAAYLIEESLSIDNLFVFILIFAYFQVNPKYQHKILFWGIVGAMVLRAIFIITGVALINKFHWIIYIFGAFLIFTGIRMAFDKGSKIEPDKNPIIKLVKRIIPVTTDHRYGKFFVRIDAKLYATPLFIALVMIEFTDLVFAVDSIPAVLAISKDPFIVYTSNVFAILGLRSLFFALSSIISYFRFLKYGLSAILFFVGVKMCISSIYKIPIGISLGALVGILAISIILSVVIPQKHSR